MRVEKTAIPQIPALFTEKPRAYPFLNDFPGKLPEIKLTELLYVRNELRRSYFLSIK